MDLYPGFVYMHEYTWERKNAPERGSSASIPQSVVERIAKLIGSNGMIVLFSSGLFDQRERLPDFVSVGAFVPLSKAAFPTFQFSLYFSRIVLWRERGPLRTKVRLQRLKSAFISVGTLRTKGSEDQSPLQSRASCNAGVYKLVPLSVKWIFLLFLQISQASFPANPPVQLRMRTRR